MIKRKAVWLIALYLMLLTGICMMCIYTDNFLSLLTKDSVQGLGISIVASLALYLMPLILNLFKIIKLTQENHWIFTRLDFAYTLSSVFVSILCLALFNIKMQDPIFECRGDICNNLHDLVSMLIWLRMFPIIIIGFTWLFTAIGRCCNTSDRVHSTSNIERIKAHLEERSKKFEELDCEARATPCAICMCEFGEPADSANVQPDEKIVQLSCSDKHIFHLQCIQDWAMRK